MSCTMHEHVKRPCVRGFEGSKQSFYFEDEEQLEKAPKEDIVVEEQALRRTRM